MKKEDENNEQVRPSIVQYPIMIMLTANQIEQLRHLIPPGANIELQLAIANGLVDSGYCKQSSIQYHG